ncbi:MAG: hypothetical protein OEV87_03590 [Phycisphaerae bacterium]|nr:hypothetical protein [Phycisphaerae bacterium]
MKDAEKYLIQSKKAMLGNIIFASVSITFAFIVWIIWNPAWWVYLVILSGGLFGLVGDLVNIGYCKKKIRDNKGI